MNRKILFCNCGGNLLKTDFLTEIREGLLRENISCTNISDLCSMCTNQPEYIHNLFAFSDEILIVACHSRAVRLLLQKTGIEIGDHIQLLNFLEYRNQELLQQIKEFSSRGDLSENLAIRDDADWPAWFPLIDYDRCSSCGQCADFCLFGVYEKQDNRILVVNPKGCKNNCPACARICPQTAIVFPKYVHGGAIAGDESIDEREEQSRQQKDIDTILGSEIYQALERRKLKRQSIIRNNALQEAEREREEALKESRKK